jgi:hypothetical protein
MTLEWPERLWIVRHGQSAGNVARDQATASTKTAFRSVSGTSTYR